MLSKNDCQMKKKFGLVTFARSGPPVMSHHRLMTGRARRGKGTKLGEGEGTKLGKGKGTGSNLPKG